MGSYCSLRGSMVRDDIGQGVRGGGGPRLDPKGFEAH